ncbi:MAG: serine/threonine-protein kinase, partial [Myxococcota bacterium]
MTASVPGVEPTGAFGPYTVVGPLGHGGMGTVVRAVHRVTGVEVALKTVRVRSPGALRALDREIAGLRRIRHPGIVAIVDAGHRDGVPWVAMERVDGEPLRLHLERWSTGSGGAAPTLSLDDADGPVSPLPEASPVGPVQLQRGLDTFRWLCEPLGWLHGEGWIHGDLKPDNVVMRPNGQPVLVDLGLVRPIGDAFGRDALDVHRPVGTPEYLAPEQCRGELLATGRPPFVGTPAEVTRGHREGRAPPPSDAAAVPPGFDALVAALLAKDPRDRPGYAADVAQSLAGLGAVAPAPPPSRVYLYRTPFVGQ